jgi:uncharacterized protein (TIGR02271 family)
MEDHMPPTNTENQGEESIMAQFDNPGRSSGDYTRLFDYTVVDHEGHKIGTLNNIWPSETSDRPAYIGVLTGWLFGRDHVVPARNIQIDDKKQVVRLPFSEDKVKNAPDFEAADELSPTTQRRVDEYYGIAAGSGATIRGDQTTTGKSTGATGRTSENVEVPIHEEKVSVGKRSVDAGSVRLRKVVRTETVQQPVELKREDVVIERVGPGEVRDDRGRIGEGEETTIPLKREEAVVEKRTEVTGGVRAKKTSDTERENVSETVRKEDVQVQRQGDTRRRNDPGVRR